MIVGLLAAAVAGYVLVNVLGMRKATPVYQLIAAGAGIWLHNEFDLPVAKRLAEAGL